MREFRFVIVLSLLVLGFPLQAPAQSAAPVAAAPDPRTPICLLIEQAARANALPVDFFVRVIWQESRLRPDVIGPITRSGERAEGIAQFMPGTAAERSLVEPFNPVEALPKSAAFLAELRDQFGNLGLAAAAYNAGPQRVRDFIAGSHGLPAETRNYVLAITGRPVEDWAQPIEAKSKEANTEANKGEPHAQGATASCRDVVALLTRTPNPSVAVSQQRRVPSWCSSLHHPNISVCGAVHLADATGTSSLARPRAR